MKLDQIRSGGYYIGANGKPHDAHGRPIKEDGTVSAVPEPPVPEPQATDRKGALPQAFPGRKALIDAGVDTWESLGSIVEVLSDIDGLDAATIEAIKAELAGAE